jgi:hypothetical protein
MTMKTIYGNFSGSGPMRVGTAESGTGKEIIVDGIHYKVRSLDGKNLIVKMRGRSNEYGMLSADCMFTILKLNDGIFKEDSVFFYGNLKHLENLYHRKDPSNFFYTRPDLSFEVIDALNKGRPDVTNKKMSYTFLSKRVPEIEYSKGQWSPARTFISRGKELPWQMQKYLIELDDMGLSEGRLQLICDLKGHLIKELECIDLKDFHITDPDAGLLNESFYDFPKQWEKTARSEWEFYGVDIEPGEDQIYPDSKEIKFCPRRIIKRRTLEPETFKELVVSM